MAEMGPPRIAPDQRLPRGAPARRHASHVASPPNVASPHFVMLNLFVLCTPPAPASYFSTSIIKTLKQVQGDGDGDGGRPRWKEPQLPHQHPSPHQRDGEDLQDRSLVQVAGKGLLARLMPEQCTAGIRADCTPQKRPSQQRSFGHPPSPLRGTDLVKTEQHERPQIDQRKQAKGIREGDEGREVHARLVSCVGLV